MRLSWISLSFFPNSNRTYYSQICQDRVSRHNSSASFINTPTSHSNAHTYCILYSKFVVVDYYFGNLTEIFRLRRLAENTEAVERNVIRCAIKIIWSMLDSRSYLTGNDRKFHGNIFSTQRYHS
jgi:hypothetical protein